MNGARPSSVVVSICGGTGAGKTNLVNAICAAFPQVAVLDQNSYHLDRSGLSAEEKERLNHDHPSAIDHELLFRHLCDLLKGIPIEKPRYRFASHSRQADSEVIKPAPLIIVEGVFALWDPRIRDLATLKVYVDADPDVRFIRCLDRDLLEPGRTVASVTSHYLNSVRPMHHAFVGPLKIHADLLIDGTKPVSKALNAVCDAINASFQSQEQSITPHDSPRKDNSLVDGTWVHPHLSSANGGTYSDYVSSALDWNLLTGSMRRRVLATGAAVFALEGDELVCIARSGKTTPEVGARANVRDGLLPDFVKDGRVVDAEPRSQIGCERHCPSARCSVAIPLFQNNTVIGIFEVFSDEKDTFSSSEVKSLGVFSKVLRETMGSRTALPERANGKEPSHLSKSISLKNTVHQQASPKQSEGPEPGTNEVPAPTWEDLCKRIIADYENSPEAQSDPIFL